MSKTSEGVGINRASERAGAPRARRGWQASLRRNPALGRFLMHRAGVIGLLLIAFLTLLALAAPLLSPHSPDAIDLPNMLAPPSATHWFGTDPVGRDIFSRCLWGARISLIIGLVSVSMGSLLGLPAGAICAFVGGWPDRLVMRLVDILLAFPPILLAIIAIAVFGPGLTNAMIAIGISQTPVYARLMRSSVLKVRAESYVESARSLGIPEWRILACHVMPNAVSPIIVQASLSLASAILSAAYLGFLGLGAQPPTPEWGSMLSKGRDFLRSAPHASIFPGLFIMVTVLSFNLLGDGLTSAMDPKHTRR